LISKIIWHIAKSEQYVLHYFKKYFESFAICQNNLNCEQYAKNQCILYFLCKNGKMHKKYKIKKKQFGTMHKTVSERV